MSTVTLGESGAIVGDSTNEHFLTIIRLIILSEYLISSEDLCTTNCEHRQSVHLLSLRAPTSFTYLLAYYAYCPYYWQHLAIGCCTDCRLPILVLKGAFAPGRTTHRILDASSRESDTTGLTKQVAQNGSRPIQYCKLYCKNAYICRNRLIRSSMGGCVEPKALAFSLSTGFTKNRCRTPSLTFIGSAE